MALVSTGCNGYFVDHKEYLLSLYKNVKPENISYGFSAALFSIIKDRHNRKRKFKHEKSNLDDETKMVKEKFENLILELQLENKDRIEAYNVAAENNVRSLSQQLFEDTVFQHVGIQGGNNSQEPLKCMVKGNFFLIPPNSRFYCGCVLEQCKKISGERFDLVIADPPWWNKYIRRLKAGNPKLSYTMMYNEDIASIPLKELLSPNSLIAVWCTNAPSNIKAVKEIIFPKWGAKYVATWYWMKIATDLRPLCDFGEGHAKQPYERIMLGTVGNIKDIPDGKIVVSVPSALHSHKPPISDLLYPYLNTIKPNTLELFARYLLPNTTSIGYEPLKWQHISLYDEVS